ncbi:MAG: hypothetical protein ABJB12_14080 [Pseudomonadota bacterium]
MNIFLAGCVSLFALQGCLSSNYQVSQAELLRLAHRPPAQRGEQLRVLQQTTVRDDVVDWQDIEADDASGWPDTHESANVTLSGGGRSPPGVNGAALHRPATSVAWGPKHAGFVHGSVRSGSGSSSSGGGGSLGGGGDAGEAIVLAMVAAVIANGAGIGLAAVEGRRFDGWARVDPDEWLLLVRPSANQWLRLSALTERDAEAADHAVIVDHDANVQRLDRAPLDRKGLAYEVELGTALLNSLSGSRDYGFSTRTGIGYFPTQRFGLLFADQFAFGYETGGALFNGRLGLELEYLPVQAGRFHAGFYTELGGALAIQDRPDRSHAWSGMYAAGGLLAQIDWTTRLAVNLRAGISALPEHPASHFNERNYVPELTLGIGVY